MVRAHGAAGGRRLKVIRYKDAAALGLKRYFTGKPCPKGHVAERYTGKRSCVACNIESEALWRARNREYKQNHWQEWSAKNVERLRLNDKERRKQNPDRVRKKSAARRVTKLSATPPWLTDADRAAIASIYADAASLQRETGLPHHVDHIVPLRGKFVCGLHVPGNLQVIPANDNLRKRNAWVGWWQEIPQVE